MQQFLQPSFQGNVREIFAYRFSKFACGGGSVYKAKYSAHYLNDVSKPGKMFLKTPQQCS